MTTRSELIRQSELLNQLVLDRTTLEELGRVEVLWMYPQSHRVLGFICKSGLLGGQKSAFHLGQLEAIGASGALVQGRPDKTTADRVRRLESLIDHEIWSNEGSRVGHITDCLFDLRSGEITAYLFTSSGWGGLVGELYELPPYQILSFGKQRVLVSETARFELYQAGLSQKLEATTEQAKEQFQQLTEQARTRAQRLSQRLGQQTQGFLEQAREKTQVILEQAKETTQLVTEQVGAGLETLTTQAEEAIDSLTDEFSRRSAEPGREADRDPDWDFDFDQAFDFDQPEQQRPASNRSDAPAPRSGPASPSGTVSGTVVSPAPDPSELNPWGDVSDLDAPMRYAPSAAVPAADLDDWDDWDDDVWGESLASPPAPAANLTEPPAEPQDWEEAPAARPSAEPPEIEHPEADRPEPALPEGSLELEQPAIGQPQPPESQPPEPQLPESQPSESQPPELHQPELDQPQPQPSEPQPPATDQFATAQPELHPATQNPEPDRSVAAQPEIQPPPLDRPIINLPRSPELKRPIIDLPRSNPASDSAKPPSPNPDLPADPDSSDDEPWI